MTAFKGKALIEPIYYEYPLEEEAYNHRNQYNFGDQLMVAPITKNEFQFTDGKCGGLVSRRNLV